MLSDEKVADTILKFVHHALRCVDIEEGVYHFIFCLFYQVSSWCEEVLTRAAIISGHSSIDFAVKFHSFLLTEAVTSKLTPYKENFFSQTPLAMLCRPISPPLWAWEREAIEDGLKII